VAIGRQNMEGKERFSPQISNIPAQFMTMCVCYVSCLCCCSFRVLTKVAALCLKMRHLNDKYFNRESRKWVNGTMKHISAHINLHSSILLTVHDHC
jgi:hypothetical protein